MLVDFLQLKPKHTEPQLHSSILKNMKQFILELGKGDFLHIDDEFTVKVGNKNKRIDMVFYHRSLQCLVAEYHRLLVPRDVATRSLAEYCEYLKNTLGY